MKKNYLNDSEKREKILPVSIFIGLSLLVILGCILSFSFDLKKSKTLHYEEKSNLDYKVYLKPNAFYDTPYLDKDKSYISALINYVDSTFRYSFKSDEKIDINYDYYIDAVLRINNTTGENIYEKQYTILNKKQMSNTTNTFNINENVKIDYEKYNTIAKQFVSQYKVNGKAELEVSLHVDVIGKHEKLEKNIDDTGVIKLNIPLLEDINSIKMDYNLVNNKDAVLKYDSTKIKNMPLFIITTILILLDIIVTLVIDIKIIKRRDASTLYELKLNKIKKEYDRYLSETVLTQKFDDMYKTKSLRIILLKSFEDLLDVRDNLKKPILFNEEIPGKETVFYIISDNMIYLYVMHVTSFEKKKKNKTKGLELELNHELLEDKPSIKKIESKENNGFDSFFDN